MLLWLLYTTVVLTAIVGTGLLLYIYMWKRLQERRAQLKPVSVRARREY